MITKKQQFEEYKMVHDFVYPNEPLKAWIDENNFVDTFNKDWNSLILLLTKIGEFIKYWDEDSPEYYNFSQHLFPTREVFSEFWSGDILALYDRCINFLKWKKNTWED